MRRVALMLVSLVSLAAAGAPATDRGAELLEPFKEGLQAALLEGLSHGPEQAIDVCRKKAPEIARAREKDGIRMGRTSDRLRNPGNTAPAWVAGILGTYVASPEARVPRSVTLPGGRRGYTEPILVASPCLTCHGGHVAPDVARRIADNYPDDRATGYQAGDFRGLFWVEYPASPPGD